MSKIFVTKPFMPPQEEYLNYVSQIYTNGQLTNQGPLVKEFESKISAFLNVENFHYVTNGTIALQLALRALDIDGGEIITTPFSYVATTSSILWEKCEPVFVDIEPQCFTLDVDKIEAAITPRTRAIMAVHVFGYACDCGKIEQVASKHGLKVIYDAAHAFGSTYNGHSLLSYGDISTCSFHATKFFHTIEGGCCIARDKKVSEKLELAKRFGHNGDTHIQLGINGKQSEFNAAMGLANFPYIEKVINIRRKLSGLYDEMIGSLVQRPQGLSGLNYNYAYYPVVFKSETELLKAFAALEKAEIFPRRYFYPSLNTLPYLKKYHACPISEDICSRIACLPLYPDLKEEDVVRICNALLEVLHG